MNISYDYYRVFYYTAKCRSITRAAAVLMNNQPNITRAIKNLENQLGCVLFTRSRQGVRLTPEGERLFEHVRIAFEQLEAAEEELAMGRGLRRGTVSIGASEVALHCLLLPVLKQYRRLYPEIRIRVSNHSTPQALSALREGLVDVAVVTTPADIRAPLAGTDIKSFREVPVGGAAFAHLAGRELTLEELAQYPLIGLGGHTKTCEFYSALFLRHGLVYSPGVEAATADQILPLVRNDLGIGFVPEEFLRGTENDGAVNVLRLDEPVPARSVCLVKREGEALSPAARRLEEMIKDSAEIRRS